MYVLQNVKLTEMSTFIVLMVKLKGKIKKEFPQYMKIYESIRTKINHCLKEMAINKNKGICPNLALFENEYEFMTSLLDSFLAEQKDKEHKLYQELSNLRVKLITDTIVKIPS